MNSHLPVAGREGDLPYVHLGVEVGGEGKTVVTGIHVHDLEFVYLVEVVLYGIGHVHVGHPWVEPAAKKAHEPLPSVRFLVRLELPVVGEGLLILRFVRRRIHVVHALLQAGLHDGHVLIGKRHVDHDVGLEVLDERLHLFRVVRINLGGANGPLDLAGDLLALRDRPAREHDLGEDLRILRTLVRGHTSYTACPDDEHPCHERPPLVLG